MKKTALIIAVLCAISFCSTAFAAPHMYIIGTGGMSGGYYPMGGALAQIWNTKNKDLLNVTVQATGGTVENIRLLEAGDVEFGIVQSDLIEFASKGMEMFNRNYVKGRAVFRLYPEVITVAVRGSVTGVNTFKDLVGKRVSFGAAGSGSEASSRLILEALGLTYKDFDARFVTNTEAIAQMRDGIIDAMLLTASIPHAGFLDVTTTQTVKILPIDEEARVKLHEKYPFLVPMDLPAGTYKGQPDAVPTLAVEAQLICHVDLPEDVVYEMVKIIWENHDELVQTNMRAAYMEKDNPLKGSAIEAHPGALKYYKEKGMIK